MGFSPGDTLQNGKYTIERRLRVGITSISYLAKRPDGSRWVLKVLDPQVVAGLGEKERNRAESLFMQEAVKLAQCSDTPHIIKSEWPFKEGNFTCLPVEYLSGNSLADRPQPLLKESVAIDYISQIGEALSVVHTQGLVHRDIRPSNIFLRIEGSQVNAVLTGFGLAVDCDTELTRTRTNELVDGFSPYELYGHNRPVGAYTDIYALAATLYELLTGVVPASAIERKKDESALIPVQAKNPAVAAGTVEAIERGLAIAPRDRPQSVAAWLEMLHAQSVNKPKNAESEVKPKASSTASPKPVDWTKWSVIVALIVGLAPVMMWLVDKIEGRPSEQRTISPAIEDAAGPEADDAEQGQEPSTAEP